MEFELILNNPEPLTHSPEHSNMFNKAVVFTPLLVLALLCNNVDGRSEYNPLSPHIDPKFGNRGLMIDAGSSGMLTH